MKEHFKQWLISLNIEVINELGIDDMVSRLDEELNIINANEGEREILNDLIRAFRDKKCY